MPAVSPVMAADINQLPADGTQRLVIRPRKATVIAFTVAMGTVSLIFAGAILVLGSLVGALACLGVGGFMVYAMASWHLWVDSERVGVMRFPWGTSCRRDQLARMEIVFAGRGGTICAFILKNGHTAFRVSAKPFGTPQLRALAKSLEVQYLDMFSANALDFKLGP